MEPYGNGGRRPRGGTWTPRRSPLPLEPYGNGGRRPRGGPGLPDGHRCHWSSMVTADGAPGAALDPSVVPAALEPHGNSGRRPRGGNGYVEPALPQLKVCGVGQRVQNVDTSTLVRGKCIMLLWVFSCRS